MAKTATKKPAKKDSDAKDTKVYAQEGEYKGTATLTLKRGKDSNFGFTFGPSKAALIVEAIDAIKKFAAKHSKK